MPKAKEIKEGLEILLKYAPDGYCDAQHDILYGPMKSSVAPITTEDREQLKALGWHWDDEGGGWAAFT